MKGRSTFPNARRAALPLLLAALLASAPALADRGHRHHHHRGHLHFGISIGAPVFWGGIWGPHPFYHPAPVYYPAPVVVSPPAPRVYIEQPAPAPQQSYWYYCAESQTYYPYVRSCAGEWQRVIPHPPPG
jgi:hypothetical protein